MSFLRSLLFVLLLTPLGACAKEADSPYRIEQISHATSSFLPKVNPISGEYVEQEVDLVVAGCEPLSFRRCYGHMFCSDRRYGLGWRINPEAFLTANFQWNKSHTFAAIGEESGSVLSVNHGDTQILEDGRSVYRFSLGDNSAYAYTNLDGLDPHNTAISFWPELVMKGFPATAAM